MDLNIPIDYNLFVNGNIVRGGTSGISGVVNIAGSRFVASQNRLDVNVQDTGNQRTPTEWVFGETLTEYDSTGTTPTGLTTVLTKTYPEKNQVIYLDDIVFYDVKPAFLP